MIPKIIHYCWFGRNPLPQSAIKCINSWKKFFPDYEIKEWNEDNFDVNIIPYTAEAYEAKKYAFVSDYARFWILYHHGGIYFDTDVEVIKPFDDIMARGPFMGIEVDSPNDSVAPLVAPGLGLGAEAGMPFYKEVLNYYQPLHFMTTAVLTANGMKNENSLQEVCGIWIYPREYFNPLNDNTGVLDITDNTRSIHWYTKTWLPKRSPLKAKLSQWVHRHFGVNALAWTRKFRKL